MKISAEFIATRSDLNSAKLRLHFYISRARAAFGTSIMQGAVLRRFSQASHRSAPTASAAFCVVNFKMKVKSERAKFIG